MRITALILGLSVALTSCGNSGAVDSAPPSSAGGSVAATADPAPPNPPQPAFVDFVQDGDSATVVINGDEQRLRLIGINTPERDECYGDEARQLFKELAEGRDVQVVTDVEPMDQYGRTLAYLYLDGILINAELVRQGAAIARPFEPNTTLQDHLEEAEEQAQRSQLGMWAPAACGGDENSPIVIAAINADAPGRDDENLNGEFIVVENTSRETMDLSGWGVKDESSVHRYTFPDGVTLAPDTSLTLFTGCGNDGTTDLYWCNDSPVWDNSGDTAFISDGTGQVRHRLSY